MQGARITKTGARLTRTGDSRIGIIALLLLVGVGLVAWILYQRAPVELPGPNQAKQVEPAKDPVGPKGDDPTGSAADPTAASSGTNDALEQPSSTVSAQQLRTAIEAVAAAEDADFERALGLWRALGGQFPNNHAFVINEAVTVLKWIDESHNRLSSGTVIGAEREKLEKELEAAYIKADEVVGQLSQSESTSPRSILIQAALIEAKARRVSYPEDDKLRMQAAQLMAGSLKSNPAQPLMASKFDDLVQILATDGDELSRQNADALFASWQVMPRNLYLLSRAADALVRNQDVRLTQLLDPSLEVTKPMLSMVAKYFRRRSPEDLTSAVRIAVQEGDWSAANRSLRPWINTFMGMSGFQPDVRIVKPDFMALLDTSFLIGLSEEVVLHPVESQENPQYEQTLNRAETTAFTWVDVDLDLDFDLVVLDDQGLGIYRVLDDGLASTEQRAESKELAPVDTSRLQGILVAEFFTVDEPSRPRAPGNVTELMSTLGNDQSSPQETVDSSRHDTYQELLLWGEDGAHIVSVKPHGESELQWSVPAETGLDDLQGVTAASALDIESDGDLDLVLATKDGIQVRQNNGNRTFTDITEFSSFDAQLAGCTQLVLGDFDSDLDQDLLATAPGSNQLFLLENILHGQFRTQILVSNLQAPPSAVAIADLDGNGAWDSIAANPQHIALNLIRSVGRPDDQLQNVNLDSRGTTTLDIGDLNNDGFVDLLSAGTQGLQYRLGGSESWSEAQPLAADSQSEDDAPVDQQQIQLADFNQDGALDVGWLRGTVLQILEGVPGEGAFLSARVRGVNDINGGGRINHFSVGSTLEIWTAGRLQRRIVRNPATHFGLGNNQADNLRIIFTNGLTQNLEKPPADTLIEERQELKGSCPFVYGWDGEKFVLITDLLWNAPLGLQVARGEVMADRRWENLLLPGELVQPRDGYYELRITEELWEFAYFDHVQLTAIDHPGDSEVFTNEKVGPPSIAEHRVFCINNPITPRSAMGSNGVDNLNAVMHRDGTVSHTFDQLLCQGLAEPHFLELDFGKLPLDKDLHLFLTGWMHPTDTSLNIGISQGSQQSAPEPPSIWVLDEEGKWVCSRPFVGFPGGKPKSIVVDLNGVFLSEDHRIRIASSQQIYWDQAFVAWETEQREVQQQVLELSDAQLRFRGFSKLMPRRQNQPHWYDYSETSVSPKWPELGGPFTRYGTVHELLQADDDQMVVMTSGDEIIVRFRLPEISLPTGWKRDFVLRSVGWDKDADLNTIAGQASTPLPFSRQESYPAPLSQASESERVWELNSPFLTRERRGAHYQN